MTEMRRLSIIIPSYNARALLRRTLRTLAVAAPEAEVIVVDGASHDGSAAMVRAEFSNALLLEQKNHGFGHAINRGLEVAKGEYLLLLNSDLFVSRAALESMMARLATEKLCAGVAPVLLNEDGTRQHVFGAFYWPNWVPIRSVTRVPLVSGACLMTRRNVVEHIGGIDETFFLYNEEWDWCARAVRNGYHLEIVPEEVVHVGGGSTSQSPELRLEAQRGFLYLAQKHAPDVVLQGLRRAMHFQGFCYSRMDPRPRHRAMWAQLESLARREAYTESPFPLSGRGDAPTQQAHWQQSLGQQSQPAPISGEIETTAAEREPITGRHAVLAAIEAPKSEPVPSAPSKHAEPEAAREEGVRRIASSVVPSTHGRLLHLRPKVAGAGG
jgi:N-acetylglucosaminyl-diphospho-decaprenol L-rhamnosyltransferase